MSEMCYEEIKELISRLLNNKENAIAVGIDGRCASGKTKLSERLKEEFIASVIHMDDFFLPRELRTKERLSSPGGNVHYERFETEVLDMENYQGNAVVNYTEYEVPYTRIIEHKHFEFGTQEKTVISREYPAEWKPGDEPYYPINNEKNNRLYERYRELADREEKVVFGGRLGVYRYMDMHHVVGAALELAEKELH